MKTLILIAIAAVCLGVSASEQPRRARIVIVQRGHVETMDVDERDVEFYTALAAAMSEMTWDGSSSGGRARSGRSLNITIAREPRSNPILRSVPSHRRK